MLTRSFKAFFLIALFVYPALAQAPFTPASTHKPTYDVQHYIINTRFDHAQKKLTGQTTVSLKPLAGGFQTLELDAAGMAIESATLNGDSKPLQFKTTEQKLI